MSGKVILEARNISKSFGPTKAVNEFSMKILSGEVLGLIGENGSGKSTFSSLVAGILPMDSGELLLNGKPYKPQNVIDASEQGVAMVVQEIGTIGTISVAANIFLNKEKLFYRRGKINSKAMCIEAETALQKIGGEHLRGDALCEELNLEDRKLVEIAKAMYNAPQLMIIDETSNALASHGREILYKNIAAVKARGGAVLFITHDLEELTRVCDGVTIMRDGRYIDTLYGDDMELDRLKELMVGRKISGNYYRPDQEFSGFDQVVLRAKDLCAYNIDHLSFELHKGEIIGIGGLADCGMHELGRLLFGLDKLHSGKIELGDGTKIGNPTEAVRKGLGYLSKNRDTEAVILDYEIGDNIVLPCLNDIRRGPFILPKEERKAAGQWVENLSIKCNSSRQYVNELSGGNKQKVVLAKWMAKGATVLIMDCPTRGIDIGVKEVIYKLMMEFKQEGKSMIMISEELPELIGMSDRLLIMKDSKIVKEFLRGPEVTEQEIIKYMI